MHREITPTILSGPRFHAPLHIFPHLLAQRGSIAHHRGRGCSLAAFNVTLLILVLKIPFNFQFDMQCAGNDNPNVSFQVNASFEQILFPRHTWARSKGLRTIGSEWSDSRDKTGLAVWPGVGEIFFAWSTAPRNQCGLCGGLSNGTVLPMDSLIHLHFLLNLVCIGIITKPCYMSIFILGMVIYVMKTQCDPVTLHGILKWSEKLRYVHTQKHTRTHTRI